MENNHRKWRIIIDVDGTQATLKFEVVAGEPPTVQEALAALQFAANQVNGMRIPVQEEQNGND